MLKRILMTKFRAWQKGNKREMKLERSEIRLAQFWMNNFNCEYVK